MRRKAATIFASLLIVWGLSSVFIPSFSRTFYTPFSISTGSESVAGTSSAIELVQKLSSGSGWTLLLIGSILVTLMQAPRGAAIGATIAYGLAILFHSAQTSLILMYGPRRYHYYYQDQSNHLGANLYAVISLLLVAVGLLVTVIPLFIGRLSKSSTESET